MDVGHGYASRSTDHGRGCVGHKICIVEILDERPLCGAVSSSGLRRFVASGYDSGKPPLKMDDKRHIF